LKNKVGIVVPTLGKRPAYLKQCLESIRRAGDAHVCIVAPQAFDASELLESGLVNQVVEDPRLGLSQAINFGISQLPPGIGYVNWLGDDDLLSSGSLKSTSSVLDSEPETVLVFGSCDYIGPSSEKIWANKSGQWASALLHFGPDLIPQPGALFRRTAFNQIGGLSTSFDWAFDFDLLLKLKTLGKLRFLNKTLASFRWHPESLSVEHRGMSIREASQVRISHLPQFLRPISPLWEHPVRKVTMFAGNRVTQKAKRLT
jgi:GT2 family glycosyltransferase